MSHKTLSSLTFLMAGTLLISPSAMARLDDPHALPADIPDIPFTTEQVVMNKDYSLARVNFGGEIGGYYDTNIFRSPTNKESDFITVINLGIALETDFEDHGFGAYAELESNFYTSNTRSNYTDLEFGMDGYLTLSNTHQIYGDFSIGKQHSPIGSFVDDPNDQLAEPVSYIASSTEAGLRGDFDHWLYSIAGLWDSYDYDNTQRLNGTTSIQDDRDRDDYGINIMTEYKTSPLSTLCARGGVNKRAYDNRIDSSAAFTRDSDGFEILSGVTYITDNLEGDFAIGYMQQNYDAVELPSVSGVAFLMNGTWDIDFKNSIRFQGDSSIKDSTNTGVSAYTQNRFRLNYTHVLNDIVTLGADAQYIRNDFETNLSLAPISRQDDVYQAEIYGQYEIYDDIDLTVSYGYRDRQSNVSTAEYDSHRFGARFMFDY